MDRTQLLGELAAYTVRDVFIGDRDDDFVQFVVNDVAKQREAQAAFSTRVAPV